MKYVNAAFEDVARAKKSQLHGLHWPNLLPIGGKATHSRNDIQQAIAKGASWRGAIRLASENQDERILQASLSPLHDAGGLLTGFVAVSRDVTEQTRTEERLQQIEKMDAVGQLAGGVAHDFNNLLQIMIGNADLCLVQKDPEPIREIVGEILDAGKRAASLVKQLLAFSKNVGEPKSIALDQLADRILPLLRRLLGEHIRIEVGHSGNGFDVWGDESQMEQVLVNLCVNARDAMTQGGKLSIHLSQSFIDADESTQLGLSRPGSFVVLEVADTGTGMSDEVQRHAFEPFFTTKAQGDGTGLGLATVYAVAKRHGGSVDLWSEVGTGSRFRVLLPQSEKHGEATAPHLPVATQRPPRLRVLLAENDWSVRKVTLQFLTAAGHDVVTVRDGDEAVSRIKSDAAAFDLLVLDAILPNVNGPEVYREFRLLSKAPVLFVTGHDFNVLQALPYDRSRGVLYKPFRASELSAAISNLVREDRRSP